MASDGVEIVSSSSNTTLVTALPGVNISLVCQSEESRPEVSQFQWEVGDYSAWAGVSYGLVTYTGRDPLCTNSQPCRSAGRPLTLTLISFTSGTANSWSLW